MISESDIEWTDVTWGVATGCTKKSRGCKKCWAEHEVTVRWSKNPKSIWFGRAFTDVRIHPELLDWPTRWRGSKKAKTEGRRPRIFVCPRSDLFHEQIPDDFIAAVFWVMATAQQHDFQILTKRPERALSWLQRWGSGDKAGHFRKKLPNIDLWPLPNVWFGASVEDQEAADDRLPAMREIARMGWLTWVSYEPALGPVDWSPWVRFLTWAVAGGEHDVDANPMHPSWPIMLRDQCVEAGVRYFFKQWGEFVPLKEADPQHDKPFGTDPVYAVKPDGASLHHSLVYDPSAIPWPKGMWWVKRVGKKRAGCLLDGKIWNEFPNMCTECGYPLTAGWDHKSNGCRTCAVRYENEHWKRYHAEN